MRALHSRGPASAVGRATQSPHFLFLVFSGNNVDALVLVDPRVSLPSPTPLEVLSLWVRRVCGGDVSVLERRLSFVSTAKRHWPTGQQYKQIFQPALIVVGSWAARAEAYAARDLLVDSRVEVALGDDPRRLADLVIAHATRVMSTYDELRRRAASGFVLYTSKEDAALVQYGGARARLRATTTAGGAS